MVISLHCVNQFLFSDVTEIVNFTSYHLQGKLLSLYNIPIDKPGGSVQNYGVCMRSFLPSDLRESVVRIIAQPMIGANAAIFLLSYTVRPNEVCVLLQIRYVSWFILCS